MTALTRIGLLRSLPWHVSQKPRMVIDTAASHEMVPWVLRQSTRNSHMTV